MHYSVLLRFFIGPKQHKRFEPALTPGVQPLEAIFSNWILRNQLYFLNANAHFPEVQEIVIATPEYSKYS